MAVGRRHLCQRAGSNGAAMLCIELRRAHTVPHVPGRRWLCGACAVAVVRCRVSRMGLVLFQTLLRGGRHYAS